MIVPNSVMHRAASLPRGFPALRPDSRFAADQDISLSQGGICQNWVNHVVSAGSAPRPVSPYLPTFILLKYPWLQSALRTLGSAVSSPVIALNHFRIIMHPPFIRTSFDGSSTTCPPVFQGSKRCFENRAAKSRMGGGFC